MTGPVRRWQPGDIAAAILAAYGRRREPWRAVLRRALIHLAHADGVLDGRGHIVTDRQRQRDARRMP